MIKEGRCTRALEVKHKTSRFNLYSQDVEN